jgi:hypothetical protein
VKPPHHPATEAEIVAAVDRALEDGEPIDQVATRMLYPDGAPEWWRDWSDEAQAIYFRALVVYGDRRIHPRAIRISASDAWSAVMESAAAQLERMLTWEDLSARLHVPVRTAQYQVLNVLGFVFSGRPGKNRRLVAGPCLGCGQIREQAALIDMLCEDCSGT